MEEWKNNDHFLAQRRVVLFWNSRTETLCQLVAVIANFTVVKKVTEGTSGGAASSHPSCSVDRGIPFRINQGHSSRPSWLSWPILLHVAARILSGSWRKWTGLSCMACWSQRSTASRAGSTRRGLWSGCRRTGGYRREAGASKEASPRTRGEFRPRRFH